MWRASVVSLCAAWTKISTAIGWLANKLTIPADESIWYKWCHIFTQKKTNSSVKWRCFAWSGCSGWTMPVLPVNVYHTNQKQVVALATCTFGKFTLRVRVVKLFFFLKNRWDQWMFWSPHWSTRTVSAVVANSRASACFGPCTTDLLNVFPSHGLHS